jgi:hypothetical protein
MIQSNWLAATKCSECRARDDCSCLASCNPLTACLAGEAASGGTKLEAVIRLLCNPVLPWYGLRQAAGEACSKESLARVEQPQMRGQQMT